MTQKDRLILPRPNLSGCLFAAILRDTRGRQLSKSERFNHFPASPFCAVTWVFHGETRLVENGLVQEAPIGNLTFSGPQNAPLISWNPGEFYGLSLGIYPEAWQSITGVNVAPLMGKTVPLSQLIEGSLLTLFSAIKGPSDMAAFEKALEPIWCAARPQATVVGYGLGDWTRALALRAYSSGAGHGLRQAQRRIKAWTGQSQRSLDQFAKIEALEQLASGETLNLAELAQDAGFADQSHMGRVLQQVTGASPARLLDCIEQDESYWAYRLLGTGY